VEVGPLQTQETCHTASVAGPGQLHASVVNSCLLSGPGTVGLGSALWPLCPHITTAYIGVLCTGSS